MSIRLSRGLLGIAMITLSGTSWAQDDHVLSTQSLPHPPIVAQPPVQSAAVQAPWAPPQFRTARLAISIDSARLQSGLNDPDLPEAARRGAVLLIVRYHYTNLTDRPVDLRVHRPRLSLLDTQGRRLEPSRRLTLDYLDQQNLDTPGYDKLNPLVSVTTAAVFEISPALFDARSWSLLVKAGQSARIALDALLRSPAPSDQGQ